MRAGLDETGALRDRRLASQDASKSAVVRQFEEGQARKHAEDVCRVIAMLTREESEPVPLFWMRFVKALFSRRPFRLSRSFSKQTQAGDRKLSPGGGNRKIFK